MTFTDTVRDHARGQWRDILPAIGIPAEALTNRHKPCPCCGGRDRFRFDDVNGTGSFICSHYGNGGGDGFHLVQHYLDCDFKRAVNAVAGVLGLREGENIPPRRKPPRIASAPFKDQQRILGMLWLESRPVVASDPVCTYLQGRGLDWEALHDGLDLRHHPALPYWHNHEILGHYPAMMAAFTNAKGHMQGLHITYLHEGRKLILHGVDGLLPAKKMRSRYPGALKGCAIRLYPPIDKLAVAEGIESALAVREITGWPVWACGSAHGLQNVELPQVRELAIYCDHDPHGQGWRAGRELMHRAMKAGITCRPWMSAHTGEDILDELNRIKEARHG